MSFLLSLAMVVSPAFAQGKGKGKGKKTGEYMLVSGELPGTAHTLKKGEFRVSALEQSGYGLAAKTELNTSLRTWRWGPNIGVEQQLMGGGGSALSLGVNAMSLYSLDTQTVGAGLMYTGGPPKDSRYNLGAGVAMLTMDPGGNADRVNALSTNLHGGYDLVLAPKKTVQFTLDVDPLNSGRTSAFIGTGSVSYNRGWKTIRARAGLQFGDNIAEGSVNANWLVTSGTVDPLDLPRWMPMPFVDVWAKF